MIMSRLVLVSVGTTMRASGFGDMIWEAFLRSFINAKYAPSSLALKKGDVKEGISRSCLKTVSIVVKNCKRCFPSKVSVVVFAQVGLAGVLSSLFSIVRIVGVREDLL